jgi:hypothetical protein
MGKQAGQNPVLRFARVRWQECRLAPFPAPVGRRESAYDRRHVRFPPDQRPVPTGEKPLRRGGWPLRTGGESPWKGRKAGQDRSTDRFQWAPRPFEPALFPLARGEPLVSTRQRPLKIQESVISGPSRPASIPLLHPFEGGTRGCILTLFLPAPGEVVAQASSPALPESCQDAPGGICFSPIPACITSGGRLILGCEI